MKTKTNKEIIEDWKKEFNKKFHEWFLDLCNENLDSDSEKELLAFIENLLDQKEREVRLDLKELFKARKVLTDTIASDVNSYNFNIYDVRRQIKDLDKLIIKLSNLKSNKKNG